VKAVFADDLSALTRTSVVWNDGNLTAHAAAVDATLRPRRARTRDGR
jgi:hypothetical protein